MSSGLLKPEKTLRVMEFVSVWTEFAGFKQGVIVQGCPNTEYEFKEYGDTFIEECFDPPPNAGRWRWRGVIHMIVSPIDGDIDVEYSGKWTAL